jgi:hypothetical protein
MVVRECVEFFGDELDDDLLGKVVRECVESFGDELDDDFLDKVVSECVEYLGDELLDDDFLGSRHGVANVIEGDHPSPSMMLATP